MAFLNLGSNLRHAVRSLRRSPGHTTVGLLTLGLGIGLSTASFCLIDSLVLRHLPYPQSEELVCIFRTARQFNIFLHSPASFLALRERTHSFADFSICKVFGLDLVRDGAPAEWVGSCAVSGNFFDLIRMQPERGRGFTAADEQSGAPLVVVITHRMWQQRFGGDPAILGRFLRLSRQSYEIVGVLPAAFEVPAFWGDVELFYPFQLHPAYRTMRDNRWLEIVARPKPGVTRAAAQAELDLLAARLAQEYPQDYAGDGFEIRDIRTAYWSTPSRVVTGLMIGLSALLLLATCINLAVLQFVRCLAQRHDLAVRAALGASRWQEMAPVVCESLLLALGGGLLGLLVASWANVVLGRYVLFSSALALEIPLGARALGVATALALLAGLGLGLLPSFLAARTRPIEALNEAGHTATESPSDGRIRRTLVVAEVAIALTLFCTAAVFATACSTLTRRERGWNTDHVFHAVVFLPWEPYGRDLATFRKFCAQLPRDLAALPGVAHAALSDVSPLWGYIKQTGIVVEGRPPPAPGSEPLTCFSFVSPEYFATLEAPLRQGRAFTDGDRDDRPRVAIVNRALAAACWPGRDPIGQHLRLAAETDFAEVVGVAGDLDYAFGYEKQATSFQVYFPLTQRRPQSHHCVMLLRTRDDPAGYLERVRRVVARHDPDLALIQTGTIPALLRQNNRFFDMVAGNLVVFAGIALFIAALGIYGVISNLAALRLRSLAIRAALGAAYGDLMRLILGHGLRLVGTGLLLGAAVTIGLVHVLVSRIPGMSFPGLWMVVIGLVVLGAIGLLACWLPAHRAARVDPLVVLRGE